jgi:hypothetical protein
MVEEYDNAEQFYREALKTAMSIRAVPVALNSITGLASLIARRGYKEHAAELACLVLANLAADQQTIAKAESLVEELRSELDADTLNMVQERASQDSLGEVVKTILEG